MRREHSEMKKSSWLSIYAVIGMILITPFSNRPTVTAFSIATNTRIQSRYRHRSKSLSISTLRCTLFAVSPLPLDGDENMEESPSILSQRIRQLQEKETREAQALSTALSTRLQELQKSESTDRLLQSESTQIVNLPVLAFDALLPKQILEGRTDDPTFCVFLRELGLGGWFVMTSVDPLTRKIRRHGVLVKIVAVDALKTDEMNQDRMTQVPTAVDFQMVGRARCRIIGNQRQGMTKRIGRWRRCHDPNGEQVLLGWGDERFIDASPNLIINATHDHEEMRDCNDNTHSSSEWNNLPVLINLEAMEAADDDVTPDLQGKIEELSLLVDEWYSLAANTDTYKNMNVTASTRRRKGHPELRVEPDKLLARVAKQLGPRPTQPTAFCFWAAAMINPLPALGVSLEIRGRLLEALTIQGRLEVVEGGLRRSIDNLRGRRPLG